MIRSTLFKTRRKNFFRFYSHLFSKKLTNNFKLQLGGILPEIHVTWEVNGPENAPVIMVIPALLANSHICSNSTNSSAGWWEGMVGPGKWIDTDKWRVICATNLGSPAGTTSPISVDPTTGKKYSLSFPQITTLDQARVHKLVLDELGLKNIHAIIGSSLGGMQALQFVIEFPEIASLHVNISATEHTSPGTVSIRRVQRLAVISDPKYHSGDYEEFNQWPHHGMKVARSFGLLSYCNPNEFNENFDWKPKPPYSPLDTCFEIEKWMDQNVEPFASTFDPNCYLLLTRCMDLMDISMNHKSRKDALKRIKAKNLILASSTDTLIPPKEQRELHHNLQKVHAHSNFSLIASKFGHDAFLHDIDAFGEQIKPFLET